MAFRRKMRANTLAALCLLSVLVPVVQSTPGRKLLQANAAGDYPAEVLQHLHAAPTLLLIAGGVLQAGGIRSKSGCRDSQ